MNEVVPNGNAIQVIEPYLWRNVWVFDDEEKGIEREPFVFGMSRMIDEITDGVAGAESGFYLYFSKTKPPTKKAYHLKAMRSEMGGVWYREVATRLCGWLCPATLAYFQYFPEELYVWAV